MSKVLDNWLTSHASKVTLKILQARPQHYVNWKLSDVQAGFRKGRGTRDQIVNICWIIEKAREFQEKHLPLIHWLKSFTVWIITNCGKLLKRWEYQTILPVSWETCIQVKKKELEFRTLYGTTDWFKIGKGEPQSYKLSFCLHNFYEE